MACLPLAFFRQVPGPGGHLMLRHPELAGELFHRTAVLAPRGLVHTQVSPGGIGPELVLRPIHCLQRFLDVQCGEEAKGGEKPLNPCLGARCIRGAALLLQGIDEGGPEQGQKLI